MKQPIEQKYWEKMQHIAMALDDILNGPNTEHDQKNVGFTLFIYDMNTGPVEGRMNYISNAVREDFAKSLREMLAQVEGRYHDGEKGTVQ